jgi:hypothetical protein
MENCYKGSSDDELDEEVGGSQTDFLLLTLNGRIDQHLHTYACTARSHAQMLPGPSSGLHVFQRSALQGDVDDAMDGAFLDLSLQGNKDEIDAFVPDVTDCVALHPLAFTSSDVVLRLMGMSWRAHTCKPNSSSTCSL